MVQAKGGDESRELHYEWDFTWRVIGMHDQGHAPVYYCDFQPHAEHSEALLYVHVTCP